MKSKPFQILGFDIMIDENYKCWLIEINAYPSLVGYLSQFDEGENRSKTIRLEMDRYLKGLVVQDACKVMMNHP